MSLTQDTKGLSADLENFELTDVIQLITQQVKSGILSVEGEGGISKWFFTEGCMVDFNCQLSGHSLDLETILVKAGHLDKQRYLSFQERYGSGPTHALEKGLVKNKVISREELEKINLNRLIESFIITLQWVKGRYNFISTKEIKNNPFLPSQDTNFIILEAMRQIDEIAVMKKRLPPLEKVYETTLSLDRKESSAEDASLFEEGLEKQFNKDEYRVYSLFNGKNSLIEVLNTSIIGQFNTCSITLGFIDRGIIAPQTSKPTTSKSTGYHHSKSYKFNYNLTGVSLLLLTGALLISVFITALHPEKSKNEKNPTFFSAIMDNLQADQQKNQERAKKLLH